MSNEAREQLRQQFEVIRDERRKNANTAERIGNAFLSLLSYLDIGFDIPTLDISKINGLQAELDKKLNKTDFGASFATEMAKWFAKDSDGNIYVADKKGFYSNSFISALGLSASTGGGGSFDLLQDWNKYVDETAKSTALSAYLGKDLLDRIKAIDLSGYATTTALAEVSKKTAAITTKVNDFLEGTDTDGIINKWKELEAFLDGQTQTSTLAELLAVKADKSVRVNAGTGLAGGGSLSADITLSLATVGTAGTYTKVTVDKYGRVTGHSSLTAADIPTLEISKINGLQAELDKKLNKTDFGTSFATEMAKWFAKDPDGNIYVANEKGFYSNSFISALGLSDNEGGSGVVSYDRLDNWADYAEEKATWVLSAKLGNELNSRVSALEAGGATSVVTSGSGNVVTAVTKSGTVITATKGITALTSHQAIYALTLQGNGSTIGTYNPKSANATINITPANIGAATSGHKHTISILTDLGEGWDALLKEAPSEYVTRWPAFSEITDTPSTLAGYGITDGVNGVTVTGNGNAVTAASVNGHTLTLTKGSTFLLSSAYTAADVLAKIKTVDGSGSGLDADMLDGVHLDGLFTGLSWSTQTLSITIGGVSKTAKIPYATSSVAGLVSTGTQTFGGLKTFNSGLVVPAGKSLKIGNGTITWDSDKGCFHFSHGLYSDDFVSALGISDSTGGGGTSYDRLDAWGDYDSSKASWVLSAKLGNELNSRVSALEAGGATSVVTSGSGNVVTAVTKSGTVITATKGITALTSHQAIYALTLQGNGSTIGTYNPKSANATINITPANIGAATSGHKHTISILTDLGEGWDALLKEAPSEYVTRWPAFSEITDTPSTLAGYGITDGVNGVTVTGNGNAVTAASVNGHTLTLTKGSTFLLSSAYTAADVLAKIKTVDGSGSGLDADMLDGVHLDGLFTGLSWSTQTLSITIGGVSKTAKIPYATSSVAGLVSTGTQTFGGLKTFNSGLVVPAGKSLKIGNGTITWDSDKGCFHFSHGLYSDDFVSALGLSDSTGGGGTSYDRLDAWGDYTSEKASWVLSAKLGYDLNTRVSALEGGSAMNFEKSGTGNALTGFSKSGNTVTFTTGTFLTSHQKLYTLTLQRNGEGIGSYVPTADKVININACTAITMPKGFTVGTLSSVGVIGVTFASGYSLPTTAKQQQWDTAYSFVSSIMGSDADGVIDKWNEIISFLDGIGDSSTLEGLLNDINGNVTVVGNRVTTLEGYFTNGIAKQAAKTTGTLSINGKSFNGSANITVGTMGVAYGGTGKSSVASGSMLYASAANVYSELATTSFGRNLLKANSGVVVTGLNADTLDGVHLGGIFTDISWSTQKLSLTIGGVTNSVTIPYATTSVPGLVSTGAQTFAGAKTFNAGLIVPSGQSIKIGGGTITWDSAKGCFHISHGLYSDSFISALGVSDSTGGGGGSSLDRLDDWDDYSTDRATWVLSAKLGADLNTRLKSVEAGSATSVVMAGSGNAVTSITKSGTVITATKGSTFLLSSAYTAADILSKLKTVDGSGSGLDADLLDGTHKSGLLTALSSSSATNLSLTVGGTTKTIADLYATQAVNADMLDGLHVNTISSNEGIMRSWKRGAYTTVNQYFGNGNVVVIDPNPTDDSTLWANTTIFSLGDMAIRNHQLAFGYATDIIKYRRNNDGWNAWKTIAFTDSNVSSATRLQTARTLWGQSFNGTANVSGSMTGVGSISMNGGINGFDELNSSKGSNGRSVTISREVGFNLYATSSTNYAMGMTMYTNSDGSSLGTIAGAYGGGNTLIYFYYGGSYSSPKMVIKGDNVGIGTTSPSYKLDVNGSVHASSFVGSLSGNASSATKLATARTINGTNFDGTANITTVKWGTARNIYIRDASQAHTGAAVSVDGSATEYLLLPSTITATLVGNADTATELQTPRTINGTYFSGVSNITTSYWGLSRNIYIQDATEAHTGAAVSVNGSANVNLKLPSTITATLVGNASSATKLATARTLWGRSFDGTANVSGSLSGVGTITGSGTLALVGNDDIYLKRGGADNNSLVLAANEFRPFSAANNNIDLGSSSAKWRNLYVAGTANVGSITIGSGKITWDSAKGCFHFSHGLYSESFVSALGANSSASGGGGSYERLDSWSDYSSDKATWVLSALLGHELNSRVSALEAGGATSVVTSGSGNVVTAVTKSGTVITATKGITALTSHQAIYALTLQGNGSTIGTFNPKSANATINLTAKNLLLGRGLQNPQTGRTQNFGRLYSYYTSGPAHENAPTTYTAVIGFGSDNNASVEIAGGWTSGMGLWYRALRDVEDDWFGWRKVLDESNYASVLDARYYTESEINTKLTNGSVTKVGTASVGSTVKPIYLNGGVPTALSANAGNSTHPVYLNAGAITQCGSTLDVSISGGATYLSSSSRMDYGWNGLNYFNADLDAGCAAKVNDSPTSAWWHILRFNHANSSGYYTDLAIPFNSDSIYWKTVRSGKLAHSAWARVLDSLNYTSYTVTKTGGGASGTWGIGISGNASTASKWQTARTLSLTGAVTGSASIDGSGNVSINTTYATGNISSLDSRYVNISGDTMSGTLTTHARFYAQLSGRTDKVGLFHSSTSNRGGVVLADTGGTEHVLYLTTDDLLWKGRTVWDSGNDGSGSGLDADLLDGTHKSGLLTALTSSSATNLSLTVGGTTKTIADLYATQAVNADKLDNLQATSFMRCDGTNSIGLYGGNGNTAGWRLVMEKTCGGWTICNIVFSVTSRHTGQGVMNIGFHITNEEGTTYIASINLFGSTASNTSSPWRAFYNTSTKKFRLFWYYNDYNNAQINVLSRSGFNAPTNGTWYEALPSDNGTELTIYYNNAATATKLLNARNINGTAFNGTADITTAKWGTARNIYIRDASQAHTGAAVSVDGSATEYLLLPSTITATLVGNASSATKLATARTINGTSFDGTENITTAKWGTARTIYIQDASGAHGSVGVSVNGSTNYNLKLPSTITATLVGNASTATKLQTARTLWGRSFDGRANVSGDMTGVGNVTPSANGTRNLGSGTSRWANIYTNSIDVYGSIPIIRFHYNNASTATDFIGASSNGLITISNVLRIYQSSGVYVDKGEFHVAGKVVIGSTPSTYVLNVQGEIGVTGTYGGMRIIPGYVSGEAFRIDPITSSGASNSNRITLLQNGNVCIGGPTATSYKLDVSGSIYSRANIIAAGAVTALVVSSSSDARLKNIIRDACPTVEDVADAPAVEFAWKKDGSRAVGSIAQYWQGVLPQAVHEERGYLAMQYDVIAMLASIANARRILSIEKKIRELEAEVKRLKTA